jgi:hypothetical protein
MPNPNPANPIYLKCWLTALILIRTNQYLAIALLARPMRRNGYTKAGAQNYRCNCGYTVTDSDRPVGRQMIGDQPMSQAVLDRRYRLRNPEKYREIHRKTKNKTKQ